MRKTGTKWALLGVVAGAALLAGCEDGGRSRAMLAAEDYYPSTGPGMALQRGVNTGFPRELPQPGSDMGGSGVDEAVTHEEGQTNDALRHALWLRQDFRVPYPPPRLEATVAVDLGTGKPLRANAQGVWIQGTYAVELGSGATRVLAPGAASAQPFLSPESQQALPHDPPERFPSQYRR